MYQLVGIFSAAVICGVFGAGVFGTGSSFCTGWLSTGVYNSKKF